MIGEIVAVISLVKGLNDAISTMKEAGDNASGFAGVMDKFSKANDAVQEVESKYVRWRFRLLKSRLLALIRI